MKYTLNLASGTYINRRHLYGLYTAVGIVFVVLLGFNLVSLLQSRARTAESEQRMAELRGPAGASGQVVNAGDVQQLSRRIEFANTLLERDAFRWTALLDQLEEHLVDGVSIRGLKPDYKSGSLQISGVASSVGTLRRFLDRLAASPNFANVYLKQQSSEMNEEETTVIAFSIELQFGHGGRG